MEQKAGVALEEESKAIDERAELYGYGFGWRRSQVLGKLEEEVSIIFHLSMIFVLLLLCVFIYFSPFLSLSLFFVSNPFYFFSKN